MRCGSLGVVLLFVLVPGQANAYMRAVRTMGERGDEFLALPLEISDMLNRALNSGTLTEDQHDDTARNITDEIGKALGFDQITIPTVSGQEQATRARRLQEVSVPVGSDIKDSWAQYLLPPARDIPLADPSGGVAGGSCTDPLAVQSNQIRDCAYDCDQLKQHYFGQNFNEEKTRCFTFERSSAPGTWPIEGSWPAELIDKKSSRLDWWPLVPSSIWEDPPDGTAPLTFAVGRGAQCRNVTFVRPADLETEEQQSETQLTGRTPVQLNATHVAQTACLFDGVHYNTVSDSYSHFSHGTDAAFQEYRGEFQLGECTEVVVRVISDSSFAPNAYVQVTWQLSDGSGQVWTHTCTGSDCIDQHEYFTCLYDHEYTLERTTANDDGWSGTVAVSIPDLSIPSPSKLH